MPGARAMHKSKQQTALVWGSQRISDVVMSLPALKLIRAHAADLDVRYVTTFYASELIRLTGLVDDVRCVRLEGGVRNIFRWWKLRREVRQGDYEHVFLMGQVPHYRRKIGDPAKAANIEDVPNGHTAERCARTVIRGLGIEDVPIPTPEVEVPDEQEITRKSLSFGLAPDDTYLVVHSGSSRMAQGKGTETEPGKLWPPHKYGRLFDRLTHARPDLKVVFVGTESERDWINAHLIDHIPHTITVHNLAGHTSIPEMVQILKHASCLLCVDSGVMHVATMTGTPLVALFGPTDENRTGPFGAGERARVIRAVPLPEAREDPDCMEKISVDEVFGAIQQQLQRLGAH